MALFLLWFGLGVGPPRAGQISHACMHAQSHSLAAGFPAIVGAGAAELCCSCVGWDVLGGVLRAVPEQHRLQGSTACIHQPCTAVPVFTQRSGQRCILRVASHVAVAEVAPLSAWFEQSGQQPVQRCSMLLQVHIRRGVFHCSSSVGWA
jgi:hypothetical protein